MIKEKKIEKKNKKQKKKSQNISSSSLGIFARTTTSFLTLPKLTTQKIEQVTKHKKKTCSQQEDHLHSEFNYNEPKHVTKLKPELCQECNVQMQAKSFQTRNLQDIHLSSQTLFPFLTKETLRKKNEREKVHSFDNRETL